MDHEYDVVGGYFPSFVQHLKDTGTRLGLRVGSQLNEDRTSAGGTIGEVAEARASSSWTPAEHDTLFRALSVHSRWRPDLIAACVPTKTEWEVWMYLEALEEGATMLATQRDGEDVDMEGSFGDERRDMGMQVDRSSGSCSDSGSDTDENEDLCKPALEVSQAWIDVEERMASWIVHEEHLTSVENDNTATAGTEAVDDEPAKRKRGRPCGAEKGLAQSRSRGQTISNGSCHFPPPVLHSPSPESVSTSAREMLMGRLEAPHLLVLDGILRESEEAMKEKNKIREGSVTAVIPLEHKDAAVPSIRDAEVSSLSPEITALQGPSNTSQSPSNMVIDPVLLALSGGADFLECRSGRIPSEGTSTGCAPAHVPTPGPSSLPNPSQPGMGNTFTFPLDNAAAPSLAPSANVGSDLSLVSPRSRRRIQKRLYMRRKRASLRENGVGSESPVYTGVERLKPGKKARSERSEMPIVSTSIPCSETPYDAEVALPENVTKKNKPSLTLPYKLKAQFAALRVDAAYLRDQGMDLLNLSALGKLMGLCSSLEHGEEANGSAIAQSIDAQLIRHLQAAMVTFVTDMIHRAIVWREREIRLKQRSRAWRHGDQITIGAVEHAVEAIGARYHSHKEYFRLLGAFHDLETEPSVPANASEESNSIDVPADLDVEAADRFAEPPEVSPHRDVYTPLICPPFAWKMSPLACLTRTYEREATRTRRGTSAEVEEEVLMSDETDEEELEAELNEEDEIDLWDMQLATTHEQGLWDGVRRRSAS